jgi:hypothetical protein
VDQGKIQMSHNRLKTFASNVIANIPSVSKLFLILLINFVVTLAGSYISQIPTVKNSGFETQASYLFNVGIATLNFFFATFITTKNQFSSRSINVSTLETMAEESDMILYVSSLPKFSDWFKPELIKYLVHTSPLYQNIKPQKAIRIFVIKNRTNAGEVRFWDNLCAAKLYDIHDRLRILPLVVSHDQIQGIAEEVIRNTGLDNSYLPSYDFSIGFKKQINITDDIFTIRTEDLEAFRIAVPEQKIFKDVTGFKPIERNFASFSLYESLARKLLQEMYDNTGKVLPKHLMSGFIDRT